MNFLAHIYLSGKDENLILGNFIADMVKGRQIDVFPAEIKQGIRLHRRIDYYTDHHNVVARSKNRIRAVFRHYSGVVVDMFYDHFLARNWPAYSDEPLESFVQSAYNVLMKNYNILPYKARFILPIMIGSNWLVNYADLHSLQKHMEGMARRTDFNSGMENAVEYLLKNYDGFGEDFAEFFPELILCADDYISRLE